MRAIGWVTLPLVLTACIPSLDSRPDAPPLLSRSDEEGALPPPDRDRDRDRDRSGDASGGRAEQADPREDRVVVLPAPRPAWEARPVTPDARTVAPESYVVQPGDSLSRISDRTGVASEAIARRNGLAPPFTVRAGQRLTIPGGRYHLVHPGETGIAIARAYGVQWSRIVTANQLAEPYTLRAGQRLEIPGAAAAPATRAAERAAAFSLDVEDLVTGAQPAQVASALPPRATATPRRALPATTPIATPKRLTGGFLWPVDGRVVRRFGPGASGERNDGIKIAVPIATPIRSVADGVVAYVGSGIAALGGLVIVKHGDGWTSVYGHASRLLVQRGQSVKRGDTIALSGESGLADRPEVHFELRRGRVAVDPIKQLPRT